MNDPDNQFPRVLVAAVVTVVAFALLIGLMSLIAERQENNRNREPIVVGEVEQP